MVSLVHSSSFLLFCLTIFEFLLACLHKTLVERTKTAGFTFETIFGKTGLNEICVELLFSGTHLEMLKCLQKHSHCILKRLQCSPVEIENVPYH